MRGRKSASFFYSLKSQGPFQLKRRDILMSSRQSMGHETIRQRRGSLQWSATTICSKRKSEPRHQEAKQWPVLPNKVGPDESRLSVPEGRRFNAGRDQGY